MAPFQSEHQNGPVNKKLRPRLRHRLYGGVAGGAGLVGEGEGEGEWEGVVKGQLSIVQHSTVDFSDLCSHCGLFYSHPVGLFALAANLRKTFCGRFAVDFIMPTFNCRKSMPR